MTKHTIGKEYRKEGRERAHLYTVIQCDDCGATTYERRANRIEAALQRGCRFCSHKGQSRVERERRSLYESNYRQDGRNRHPLYITWMGMLTRCYDTKHKSYSSYGGRGIEVCPRWQLDFWAFVEDVGDRPEGTTLDRIDGNGHYEPNNCRWADWSQQMSNRRWCSLLTDEEYLEQQKAKRRIYQRKRRSVSTGRPVGRPPKKNK